ncbi:unnamed protein product [Rangifer tarandus platyrhynchus]|uniref:Uncharacterized protein n=2 Tax=Rangifer tarandus platyrhynchus TaxID=3082113 RepID=A0ABN8ZRE6_RANTA|nr:unnamed protein product [Rangifer tarandus platyrhynchus]CAI9706424.1 unnamed protein product [Rangifer tarandus platyrhynchus]
MGEGGKNGTEPRFSRPTLTPPTLAAELMLSGFCQHFTPGRERFGSLSNFLGIERMGQLCAMRRPPLTLAGCTHAYEEGAELLICTRTAVASALGPGQINTRVVLPPGVHTRYLLEYHMHALKRQAPLKHL